ncbi:MAG: ATP-binding cassette domain-containing protein [Gammaproteobacteria bacterium]|nr:ATP-binding cassette domain-containing protein [Gammaproteobacteria bacterium]
MSVLEINQLSAFYGKARALNDISIKLDKGEIMAVIGANGAGKSTLLDSIVGLTRTTGDIRFEGQLLNECSAADIVNSGVGYATERFNLFPYMSVYDNLMVGAYTARDDVEQNLELVYDLFPRLKERETQETGTQSGGERQMVSLGRALMSSPKLLLIDEPTIGLAPKVCLDMAAALRDLNQSTSLTILITEQNVNFAMSLAQNLHVLETGMIRMSGTPEELKANPDLNKAYFGSS